MHDIRFIRENPKAFDEGLARRGLPAQAEALIALDEKRRSVISELQAAQERRNALSREIGEAKKARDEARAQALMAEVAALKEAMQAGEAAERRAIAELEAALAAIPEPAQGRRTGRAGRDRQCRASPVWRKALLCF